MKYTVNDIEKTIVLHEGFSAQNITILVNRLRPVYPGIDKWEVKTTVDELPDVAEEEQPEVVEIVVPEKPEMPDLDVQGEQFETLEKHDPVPTKNNKLFPGYDKHD